MNRQPQDQTEEKISANNISSTGNPPQADAPAQPPHFVLCRTAWIISSLFVILSAAALILILSILPFYIAISFLSANLQLIEEILTPGVVAFIILLVSVFASYSLRSYRVQLKRKRKHTPPPDRTTLRRRFIYLLIFALPGILHSIGSLLMDADPDGNLLLAYAVGFALPIILLPISLIYGLRAFKR